MQCFICVTYMIILCSANPVTTREIASKHEKRSLFRDVIESLRIHSQIPEDTNQNDENNLAHNYERYGYENGPLQLASDADFVPRRNDRIEMPSLKYRFPKSLEYNTTYENANDTPKEEVVVYIETNKTPKPSATQKPKKEKRPRPHSNKYKYPNKNKENDDFEEDDNNESQPEDNIPMTNTMAGQSQIGNRESQTVVKPTVIVNIRGTVTHRDSDIRLERRDNNETTFNTPQNIFNINQEINLERESSQRKRPSKIKQDVKVITSKDVKGDEDMMMCETGTWKPEKDAQEKRKFDNVLQILLAI